LKRRIFLRHLLIGGIAFIFGYTVKNDGYNLVLQRKNSEKINDLTNDLFGMSYNARKYEIVGDFNKSNGEGTDITKELQNLIDIVSDNGGGEIFVPAGVYMISDIVYMKPRVIIKGSGIDVTIFKFKWHTQNKEAMFMFDQAAYSGLTNVTLDGSKLTVKNCNGIVIKNSRKRELDNSRNLKIEHIRVSYFDGDGIQTLFPLAWIFMLRFIEIRECDGYGIYNTITDNSFYMIDIVGCKKGAVMDSGKNNRWIGGKWFVNGDKSGEIDTQTLYCKSRRTQYIGIEMQDNYGHGINIDNAADIMFSGIISDSSGVSTHNKTKKDGIRIKDSKRISFSSCSVCNYLPNTIQHRGVLIDGECEDISLGIMIESDHINIPLEISQSAKGVRNLTNKIISSDG